MDDCFKQPREAEGIFVLGILWLCTFFSAISAYEATTKQLTFEALLFALAAYLVSPYLIRNLYAEFRAHRAFKYLVMWNFLLSTAIYVMATTMGMVAAS